MTDDARQLVEYRLAQARETLAAGRDLLRDKHYRDAINRAYYTMFYAALALLAGRQVGTSKHTGVLSLFGRHFVKTGQFPSDTAVYLRQAFEFRQKCDYREFIEPKESEAQELLDRADEFLSAALCTWKKMQAADH